MPFTQPGLFLRFERDAAGCISLQLLLHYISLQTSALRLVSSGLAETNTERRVLGTWAAQLLAYCRHCSNQPVRWRSTLFFFLWGTFARQCAADRAQTWHRFEAWLFDYPLLTACVCAFICALVMPAAVAALGV